MKLTNEQQEHLAKQLAEAAVQFYHENAVAAPEAAGKLAKELYYLIRRMEAHPPQISPQVLLDRRQLEAQLMGLTSFLRAVRNNEKEVLAWARMEDGRTKNVVAEYIWGQERFY